jgi:hypothetical protein
MKREKARPKSATDATYLYCLVKSKRAPSLTRARSGLEGTGPLRALDAGGGLRLIVANAPLELYGEAAIERGLKDLAWVSERAVAHEAVVERFARAEAIVPLKLLTLFASDERALEHVRGERKRLERVLARVAGRAEWGVRVSVEARARPVAARAGADGATSGTGFLMKKKEQRDAARAVATRARAEVEDAFERLASAAVHARRRPPADGGAGGTRLLLDAAFLVPRAGAAKFRGAVAKVARALEPQGLGVTLTGPWPPYNFVAEHGS